MMDSSATNGDGYFYTFKEPKGWINLMNPGQTWEQWTREQGLPTTRGWKVFGTRPAPQAATNREVTPLSQVIQTEVEKWENRLTDAETALHNIEAARQRQAVAEAILMSQVANWTKERDRLQDLIDTATKSS